MTPTHLDEEALSAALDGQATPEEQAHLDGCPSCREQVEGLAAVASTVGTPVPPRPAAAVDAAIRAALGAADEVGVVGVRSSQSARSERSARSSQGAVVANLADRRRFAPRVMAAAAVIVLVLGAAGVLVTLARQGPSSKASVASRVNGAANPSAASGQSPLFAESTTIAPSSSASKGAELSQGRDLGSQSNPADLAGIVDGQLAAGAVATSPNAPAVTNTAGPPLVALCVDQGVAAAGLAGQHPTLIYVATVRWQGQDAVVLVFNRPGGGRAGLVMGRRDCQVLTMLPL